MEVEIAEEEDAELVGPWKLSSSGYHGRFEQQPAPCIYGPLVMGCARVVVTRYEGIAFPVHHVETFEPPIPITDADVIDLTEFLTRAMGTTGLGTDEDFVFLHDLRFLWPRPSRVQLSALIKFVGTNKKRMDRQLKAIAILVASPLVRKLLNFFLWMFSPQQPVKMMADPEEGMAFLREHCPCPSDGAPVKQAADTTSAVDANGKQVDGPRPPGPADEDISMI